MTGQDNETVDPWVEQHGATFPILCKAQSGAYSSGGIPNAYLIAADGTVLWNGHPASLSDSDIEDALKDVAKSDRVSTWGFTIKKQLPVIPDAMSGVTKLLEKLKFGAALKKVESTLPKLEGSDKAAGEQVQAWIANNGESGMEIAGTAVREGHVYKGYLEYQKIAERFKGHDLGKQAGNAAKGLKKDKAQGLEIKASEKLVKIKLDIRSERKPEDKRKCLKALLGKKYADTEAGKEAAAMDKELEGQVKK